MTPRRPALALAALAVVAAACSGAGPRDSGPVAPTAVPDALAFVADAVDGGEVRGADHAGQHVVLWMWAPW